MSPHASCSSLLGACCCLQEGSKILFVPGPSDPGPASVLPRPPLPTYFTEKLAEEIPGAWQPHHTADAWGGPTHSSAVDSAEMMPLVVVVRGNLQQQSMPRTTWHPGTGVLPQQCGKMHAAAVPDATARWAHVALSISALRGELCEVCKKRGLHAACMRNCLLMHLGSSGNKSGAFPQATTRRRSPSGSFRLRCCSSRIWRLCH